ncbi:hypothetical protein IST4116A_01226 [Burkholderia cenocepacia]|uniref:hypothetical protein n=1 Tax=Burkholderia cenocepacia TaxID=95486 RepID=UPI0019BCAB13|nr:hypothetical protein [Burkholderia cenocepacia]CAB5083242.1 hypothetical protein IST4116B_01218 [Burkholderia cenocepacia]CAB5083923.1 hypothetical protein IST4134_01227 [Burkholderia cenocepacia]CAB5087979.1 hypothetical protein IST4113_01225 [Burkholderia cenocepacia]CAB5096025.1 hypothetical protein IST439_01265 [Burkholderia cenocepacia]CAB5105478.1 hypothetical protein IST4129_01226 [Burkholderia cenocepacia]
MKTLLTEHVISEEFKRVLTIWAGADAFPDACARFEPPVDAVGLVITFYAGPRSISLLTRNERLLMDLDDFSRMYVQEAVSDLLKLLAAGRKCLSCGAPQAADSLPCAH